MWVCFVEIKMGKKKDEKEKSEEEISDTEKSQKIQALRDMISNAEKTIQGAKAVLLQLEGKKKLGRRRKSESEEDGEIVEGTFDGQIMIGTNGKQYPVPANYASKSKLVEGDMLKLTITLDGSFIYKQIGPAERKNVIGVVSQDENGNYYILADGKPYKVLLASITYFKAEPGDEVAIVVPRYLESSWAAIENVLQKNKKSFWETSKKPSLSKTTEEKVEEAKESQKNENDKSRDVLDEWTEDIEAIKQEIQEDKKDN